MFRQGQIDKFNIHTRGGRPRIGGMPPFVACPMQHERKVRLYAQSRANSNSGNLTIELPDLNRLTLTVVPHIPIIGRFNQVKALAVRRRAMQFHIFRMCP